MKFAPDSEVARCYGRLETVEHYHCRFGVNPRFHGLLNDGGLRFSGFDEAGEARVLELPGHRFFVAALFLPQLASRPNEPHPLIRALVHYACRR